jgi:hypothetical protein
VSADGSTVYDIGQDVPGPADGGGIMTDTPQLLLAHHLKALKLPTFLREYDKLARRPTGSFRTGSAIFSDCRSVGRRTRYSVPMRASTIRREAKQFASG